MARRYVDAAEQIRPLAEPFLISALLAHLSEGVSSDLVTPAEIDSGLVDNTWEVAVCFVDLVGYTQLGEQESIEEVLDIAGRLAAGAAQVAHPPVRLVKTIGDAAMLVSADSRALLVAAKTLLDAIESDEEMPPARVGLAYGTAVTRGGEWFGRTVNLASRLTSTAAPGTLLATREFRDTAGGEWSPARPRALKGTEGVWSSSSSNGGSCGAPLGRVESKKWVVARGWSSTAMVDSTGGHPSRGLT